MSDQEVYGPTCSAGFSTAEGCGLTLRLPTTLAIVGGTSVGVGRACCILPPARAAPRSSAAAASPGSSTPARKAAAVASPAATDAAPGPRAGPSARPRAADMAATSQRTDSRNPMQTIAEVSHLARAERAAAPVSARAGEPRAAVHGGEYLAFRLGDQEYGIDIQRVQEIRSYEQPTRIANAPACIRGVVNLRGVIVPIVDLRLKLGCAKAEYNHFTVVVVLDVKGRVVGAVVDSVSDVLALAREQIKPAPGLGSSIEACCIRGVGAVRSGPGEAGRERTLILLDIEALMSSADMGLVADA